MRIAQVTPRDESVPPRLYGGTERVVSYLTEELVRQGHEITLFASGDSMTSAKLVPACPEALRLNKTAIDHFAHHLVMLERVFARKQDFDIVHFHVDYLHYPLSRRERLVNLTTLHGRLDIPDLVPVYKVFPDMPVVSISDAQRKPLPWINWQGTVHHGMPANRLTFRPGKGNYLAFLGRISPEKGLEQAIEIALRLDIPLKIAAKVDPADEEYFQTVIKPELDHPLVEFVGEIGYPDKNDFLGDAIAMLFPINWSEPFGLVMIESMACGTPVIAYPRGSVPEIICNGVNGYTVKDESEAVRAVERLSELDRRECREYCETNFSDTRMAEQYVSIYQKLVHPKSSSMAVGKGVLNWMQAGSPTPSTT